MRTIATYCCRSHDVIRSFPAFRITSSSCCVQTARALSQVQQFDFINTERAYRYDCYDRYARSVNAAVVLFDRRRRQLISWASSCVYIISPAVALSDDARLPGGGTPTVPSPSLAVFRRSLKTCFYTACFC